MLWRLHQTLRGKKRGKREAHPHLRKNYDIILGGSIFITLLAMPSSAPFKSTTSYGILLSKRLGIRGPKFGRANTKKSGNNARGGF